MRDDDGGRRLAADFVEKARAHALRHWRRRVHEQEIIVDEAGRVPLSEMQYRVVGSEEILQHLDTRVTRHEAFEIRHDGRPHRIARPDRRLMPVSFDLLRQRESNKPDQPHGCHAASPVAAGNQCAEPGRAEDEPERQECVEVVLEILGEDRDHNGPADEADQAEDHRQRRNPCPRQPKRGDDPDEDRRVAQQIRPDPLDEADDLPRQRKALYAVVERLQLAHHRDVGPDRVNTPQPQRDAER